MTTSPAPTTPFVTFAAPDIGEAEIEAVVGAMRSGWLTTGPNAAAFEKEVAEAVGGGVQAVAVNSATAGLHLALEAMGVGPGDEVIVPTWTFTATAEIVRYLGADPVIVDVEPTNLTLDLTAAAAAITPRTKAIIPVHLAGTHIPTEALTAFAKQHGVKVLEDSAHTAPAPHTADLVRAGVAQAAVFSFYATKTMTTGEGGMILVADEAVAKRIKAMRLHGISKDVFDRYTSRGPSWAYEVIAPGYKYNLTDTAAAMGRVQLGRSAEMTAKRHAIARQYDTAFADLPVDTPSLGFDPNLHAWHLYLLRLRDDAPVNRDDFITRMAEEGVGCSVHFIPLHRHPYWRDQYTLNKADFPVAEREFERVVSLPLSSALTPEQIAHVTSAVRKVLT